MSRSSETPYYVAITHHPNIPTDVLDDFTTALSPIGVHRREARSRLQASWELAGALFVVYLLKPYFDTFRKELLEGLAKAHITALKKAMRRLWTRMFSPNADLRGVKFTSDGVKRSDQSVSFAIRSTSRHGQRIEFVFHDEYFESEFHRHVDALVDFLCSYHLESIEGKYVFETELPQIDYYNVVVYNKKTQSIVVINDPVSRLLREKQETC